MIECFLFFLLTTLVSSEKACIESDILKYYRELKCNPLYENNSKCAASYDCSEIENQSDGNCRYRGIEADSSSTIVASPNCRTRECACRLDENNLARFQCSLIECPCDITPCRLGFDKSNCVAIYAGLRHCCSDTFYCKGDSPPLPECTYGGKTYVQGEQFTPYDEPCQLCYCTKDLQVVCEEWFCDLEILSINFIKRKCVPMYESDKDCCPITWFCPPKNSLKIMTPKERQLPLTANKCKFGNRELNQFDYLEGTLEGEAVRCQCLTPPYLSCGYFKTNNTLATDKKYRRNTLPGF